MFLTKVTQKGQVTIPAKVRNQTNINPNDTVLVYYDESGNVIIKRVKTFFDLQGVFNKYAKKRKISSQKMRKSFIKYLITRKV